LSSDQSNSVIAATDGSIWAAAHDGLTRLKDAKGTTVIADNNYAYNDASQIVQNIDQGGTHLYGYDVLDRLTNAAVQAMAGVAAQWDRRLVTIKRIAEDLHRDASA